VAFLYYLDGKINSYGDVDYFSFFYGQKRFYSRMGIATEVTFQLEMLSPDYDCELTVYDTKGNQVGIAKDNGHGVKEVTLPNWDGVTTNYTVRVEGGGAQGQAYRIKVKETKTKNAENDSTKHGQELTYLKIFADMTDFEEAEAKHSIQTDFSEEIKQKAEQENIDWPEGNKVFLTNSTG